MKLVSSLLIEVLLLQTQLLRIGNHLHFIEFITGYNQLALHWINPSTFTVKVSGQIKHKNVAGLQKETRMI